MKARMLLAIGATLVSAYALGAKNDLFSAWKGQPDEPFRDGEATFHKIFAELKDHYLDADLTDDQLYRAAAQGLMEHVDPSRSQWNKLFTPTEYNELLADMSGEVVGVGLDFRFEDESGMGVVNESLPETPAAAAGLKAGDRILQVDGQSFAGRQLRDMVYAIRGKEGTQVKLTLLRGASVFDQPLTRTRIPFDDVRTELSDDGTLFVSVRSFNEKTVEKVRSGIAAIPSASVKSLVVDVRDCPGGAFEPAVATASLFLPKDAVVVRMKKRGGVDDVETAPSDPLVGDLPSIVLINHETFSGCEMLAAALKQGRDATLVGETTFGKWTVQHADELPNHYAIKYTIAAMFPPDGTDYSGRGLPPDVHVSMEPGSLRKISRLSLAERLEKDPQLQAAHKILGN
jgi:carboxyl-terminal processing protease